VKKAKSQQALSSWLTVGNRFEVWSWYLANGVWRVERVEILVDDLADCVLAAKPRRRRRAEKQRTLF
jgi:hypothetical protein